MGQCISTLQKHSYRDYPETHTYRRNWQAGVLDIRQPSRKPGHTPSPTQHPENPSPRRRIGDRHATAESPGRADLHRVNSSQDTAAAEALGQLQGSPGGAEGSVAVRDWVRGGLLGAGGFGQVFMALNKDNHTLFAVKQVSLSTDAVLRDKVNKRVQDLEREVSTLSRLQHPNIVRYYGTERTAEHFNIFLEYVAGGTMANIASGFGGLNERAIARYTRQLLEGLHYLHHNKVAHRDIKGANILVSQANEVKLADFGASKTIEDLVTVDSGFKSLKGTPYWMAPEVVKGEGHGRSADIWSLGATVLEMLTGKHPWPATENHFAAFNQIAHAKGGPPIPAGVSPELTDFLALCFNRDSKQRANAWRLLQHPFLKVEPVMAPLGLHQHMREHAAPMEQPPSLLQQQPEANPTIQEEEPEEWVVSAHMPAVQHSPPKSHAKPAARAHHTQPGEQSVSLDSGWKLEDLAQVNMNADCRGEVQPDDDVTSMGPMTTYNPMQEPSGVYQYTYNQAADLMDDADSSYVHQNQPQQQWSPRQGDAPPALDPFAPPVAQRAASSPADERKVMKFVSKEVQGNHLRASAVFKDLLTDVLPARTARSQPEVHMAGDGLAKPMKPRLSQPDKSPMTHAALANGFTKGGHASTETAKRRQWETELWADVARQKHALVPQSP